MTDITPTQQFLDLAYVKAELSLDYDDDHLDSQLLQIIQTANRQMSLEMVPVLDITKFAGTGIWEDAKTIAFLYFRSLFENRVNRNKEDSESYMSTYKANLKTLIKALISRRSPKTKTIMVSTDPEEERLTLPSQKYDSILD